jgi:hypothetical protein
MLREWASPKLEIDRTFTKFMRKRMDGEKDIRTTRGDSNLGGFGLNVARRRAEEEQRGIYHEGKWIERKGYGKPLLLGSQKRKLLIDQQ